MSIDWTHFTPGLSLAGGMTIGIAAALMILGIGRIAGISGILGGLLQGARGSDAVWRAAFVIGLILSPILYEIFADIPDIRINTSAPVLVLAGLLVGFGSRLGSGCTSGHGVCGLSRRSPRSFVATLCFMASGILTVFILRHLIGMGA